MFDPVDLRKDEIEVLLEQYRSDSDENFVTAVYKTFLGRYPDPAGLIPWVTCAASDRRQVINGIMNSPEYLKTSGYFLSLLDYAEDLVDQQNWPLAESALVILYEQYTLSPGICANIGLCCLRQKKFTEAFDYYYKAYQELPNDENVILTLVQLLFILRQDVQALKLLVRYLSFNPKNIVALSIAGRIYNIGEKFEESSFLLELVKKYSNGEDFTNGLSLWEDNLKGVHSDSSNSVNTRIKESINSFEKELGETFLNYYRQIGDPEEKVKVFEEQLKKQPEDVTIKSSLAFNYFLLRNLDRSEQLYCEIIQKDGNNYDALSGLISVFEGQEKYRDLKRTCEKLLLLDPTSEFAQEKLLLANKKLCLEATHRSCLAELDNTQRHIEYLDGWYDEETYRDQKFRWTTDKSSFRLIIPEGSDLNKRTLCLRICEQCWEQRKVIVRYEGGEEYTFYTRFSSGFVYKVPYDKKSLIITLEVHPYIAEGSRKRPTGLSLSDAYITDDDPYYCEQWPIDLVIESSTLCNLRCVMCPHSLEPEAKVTLNSRENYLDKDIYKKLVPLVKQGERIQLHSIGEPLLSEMFWKLLEIVPANAQLSSVNTNFLLADEVRMDKILNSHLKYIRISLDAATQDTYQKIRRGGDLNKAKEKIKMLVEKKKARSSRLQIIINMTLMRENIDELIDFLKMGYFELGCDFIETWPLNNIGTEQHKPYYKNYNGWVFDYEEQGPWNFKEYYNRKIDEAIEFCNQRSVKFGFLKYE